MRYLPSVITFLMAALNLPFILLLNDPIVVFNIIAFIICFSLGVFTLAIIAGE